MNGHTNNIEGESILWADASLEGLEVGYEELSIPVREETGARKVVRCLGYIGFQMVGFWDEVIIETVKVHSDHPFIGDCERRLKSMPETGAKTRAATGNLLLEIMLIDGCRLWVCAHQFRCERAS
jgi:hypothetical protein